MSSASQPVSATYVASLVFRDFEDIESAITNANVELNQVGPGKFEGAIVRAQLGQSILQIGWARVGHMSYGSTDRDINGFLFALECGDEIRCNGYPIQRSGGVYYRPGAEHFSYSNVGSRWAYLAVPPERLARAMVTATGREPRNWTESCRLICQSSDAQRRMHHMLCAASSALESNSQVLERVEARAQMEEDLLAALACVIAESDGSAPAAKRTFQSRARVVAKAQEFVQEHVNQPIYIADLCAAAQTSERTLRTAFLELYGVSPNRYLKFRRLNQAHRALRHADPEQTTVIATATRFGFWDMSRFAIDYRLLFGHSPSQTLRAARDG
jgi:AraC family transcriptional regulator, ethanolamine operon transcriptional activator